MSTMKKQRALSTWVPSAVTNREARDAEVLGLVSLRASWVAWLGFEFHKYRVKVNTLGMRKGEGRDGEHPPSSGSGKLI